MRTIALLAALVALCGCQYGPAPRIPYVDGATYVAPDGSRTHLVGQGRVGVSSITPYRDGFLVADTRFFEGGVGLAYVHGDERTELGPCATGGARVNAGRTRVAWLTMGCPESGLFAPTVVHVSDVTGSGGWSREVDHRSTLFVVGFVGDAVVVTGWVPPVRLVRERGPVTVVPRLRYAVDTHGTLVAGRSKVVDVTTGAVLWHAPGTQLEAFSPDGRWLLGAERSVPVLLDARTGARHATLPRRVVSLAWEDERHLLGVAYGRRHQAMVRVGLDGRAELVGPVVGSGPYGYTFATQP